MLHTYIIWLIADMVKVTICSLSDIKIPSNKNINCLIKGQWSHDMKYYIYDDQ